MSIAAGTPLKSSRVFSLDGKRYRVVTKDVAKAASISRTWQEDRISVQDVKAQELPIPLESWHQGSGFTYDGLAHTYQWSDGWDASSPGKIRTWDALATGATATLTNVLGKGRLGWLFYDDVNGYLYMLRGRYISKYAVDFTSGSWSKFVADKDLGAANVVAGRPALFAGKLYIPVANDSVPSVAQVFQELTFGGSGADAYAAGPAGHEALCFTTWQSLLVLANANSVQTCATAPLVGANWGGTGTIATTSISNSSDTITDLCVYDQYLLVRNNRGLWSFTNNLKTTNELPDLQSILDWEGAGACYSNGRLLLPSKSGLVAWHPGSWSNVGPEQEGGLEGSVSEGWGRTRFCQPFGRYVFSSVNNATTGYGYIVSYVPARVQGRGPLIPQCHFRTADTGTYEGMCIIDNLVTTDVSSALAVISVNSTGKIATPTIFRIPRSGLTPSDDPSVTHARTLAATFTCSRVTKPSRSVQKKYRSVELWTDMSPTTGSQGLTVWASVDGATAFQLLDAAGAAQSVLTTGFQRYYFPKTTAAVGGYVELQFRIAAKGGSAALDCTVREVVLRAEARPLQTSMVRTALMLDSDADLEDHARITRDGPKQEAELRALYTRDGATSGAVAYTGPRGETGYAEVRELGFQEVYQREGEPSIVVAHLTLEVSLYS